ncbi:hypothetical protein R6Z07M_003379 [Ovis aries]
MRLRKVGDQLLAVETLWSSGTSEDDLIPCFRTAGEEWLRFSPLKPANMTKATVSYCQETHVMSTMDRSFTDQSTLQEDEQLGLSFMDAHGYSPRGECLPLPRGPQALLPQTPEPTARSPPISWFCNTADHRTKHPAGYQHGPWGYREGAAGDLYCALEE